jgi:phosphate transport system substrate-binding protein
MKNAASRSTSRFIVLLAVAVLSVSCGRPSRENELVVAGSTSIQPFADKWAELYMARRPGIVINIQGGGSSAGIQACRSGTCRIGMSSRELNNSEKDLKETIVARDGLAVVVHPSNPLAGLKLDEVRAIFSGVVRNWKVFGGPDGEITVVTREEGSGTRGAFQEMVMKKDRIFKGAITEDSNGTVREIVAQDPNAVGFISLGLVNKSVKAVALDGVMPSDENIEKGGYRLVRPFLFLTRGEPDGVAAGFIAFILSDEGQAMVRQDGLIPAK